MTLLVIGLQIHAQTPACNPPDAPPAPSCASACIYCNFINGYAGTTIGQTPSMVPNFCGTIENDQWFGFIAGATSATFSATPSGCTNGDGIQIALYPACGSNNIGCDVGCNNCGTQTQSITVNNMVIGQNYFMVIDGYAGDGCNFTVAVNPPAAVTAPQPGAPGAWTGPDVVCPGATVQYCIPINAATSAYDWVIPANASINGIPGPGPITLTGNAGRCANIKFGTTPGPVTICVRPVNSCYDGAQICKTVTIATPPTAMIAGGTQVCVSGPVSVTIPVTFTGTAPFSLTYSIDGGANITINNINTNPYNLVVTATNTVSISNVTGAGGCPGAATGTFAIQHVPASITGQPTNGLCGGVNTGSIIVNPVNGNPPFTYVWNPISAGTTNNPMNLAPGTYAVTATSADGCTAAQTFTITAPPVLTATIAPPTGANCTNPSGGSATASGSGGTPALNFVWSNGQTTNVLTGVVPGDFTVTVTDANNCTATAMVTIGGDFTPPAAVAATGGVVNCTTPTATLLGTGSATGANITYVWSTGDGQITGATNTINSMAGLPGTYTILVTNGTNGCTAAASVTVPGNLDLPTAVANSTGEITCTTTSINVDGTGSSTGATFTYNWSATGGGNITAGGMTLMPTVNAAGTYTITVTDTSNGCTATASTNVTADNQPPVASIIPPLQINCTNSTVTLDASGSTNVQPGATYNWVTVPAGGTGIVSGQGTPQIDVNMPGTYAVSITNPNGCTSTANMTVVQNLTPPVAAAATSGQVSCTTPSVPLIGTGSSTGANISYEWGTNNGQIDGPTNTINSLAGLPGTYTITVTNNTNGCTAQASVTVTGSQDFPVAVAVAAGQIDCITSTITVSGNGSSNGPTFNYLWTGPGIVSGSTTLNPVVNLGGTYTLVVTNSTNGCTADISVFVDQNTTPPVAIIAPPEQLNCINSTLTLDASGSFYNSGASFSWSTTPPGNFVSGQNTLTPIIDQPGTYTLTITNSDNGCTDTETVTVTKNVTLPVANATANGQVNCNNPSIVLSGTGSSTGANISYEWTTSNGDIVGPTDQINSAAGSPGTYQILVTNNVNGCTATDEVQVSGNTTLPTAVADVNGQIDCITTTVSISGAGSSVGPNFTYQWTTVGGSFVSGQTSLSPIVNGGGAYFLLITNTQNGCTATTDVFVEENTQQPTAVIYPPDELNCFNFTVQLDATGSITFGNSNFTWTTVAPGHFVDGQDTQNPTVDHAGVYTLKITDTENGCTDVASITVILNDTPPIADAGPNGQLTCPDPVVNIGGASSMGPDFTYVWDTQNGSFGSPTDQPTANAEAAGTYTLFVFNNLNGCMAEDEVVVTSNIIAPAVEAGPNSTISCTNQQVLLNGTGSATGTSITYLWTASGGGGIASGSTGLMPVINAPGTFTLLVTNNLNGCTSTDVATVAANTTLPTAVGAGGGLISCSQPTVSLSGAGSSSGAAFTYLWETVDGNFVSGETTLSPVVNEAGTYTLVVTNTANGCTAAADVVVAQDNSVPIATAQPPGNLNCAISSLTIDGSGSSTGGNFTFGWTTIGGNFTTGQNTLSPTVNQPGSYILTITNLTSNCTATATVVIDQNTALPPADAGLPETLTCLFDTLEIGYAIPPTDPDLTYVWTTTGGNFASPTNGTNPLVDQPGTYNLLVFNSLNQCSATATVIVSQNITLPTVALAPGGELTCQQTSLTLSSAGSSTGANFNYNWTATNGGSISTGNNGPSPLVTAAGDYILEITNTQNGCTSSAQTAVTQDANLPTAVAAIPALLTCKVLEIPLDGTGSTTGATLEYLWTTADGTIKSGAATLQPIVTKTGAYILKVTNLANDCEATFTVNVSEDVAAPTADAGPTATIDCLAPALLLDGSSSSNGSEYTYLWTTTTGQIESGETGLNPIVSKAGTYKLLITNTLNGCTASDDVVVQKDVNAPNAVIAVPTIIDCDSPTALLNGSASTNSPDVLITWTPPAAGAFVSGETTLSPTVNTPGAYILNLTNTVNGCFDETTVTVLQDVLPPVADAGSPYILDCIELVQTIGGANSSAGANFIYQWTTVGGNILSGQKLAKAEVNQPGDYTIVVTNTANGCTAEDLVTIAQDTTKPLANAGPGTQLNCQSPEYELKATASTGAGFTYDWTTVGGTFTSPTTILKPSVKSAGTYILVVTDQNNGCTATDFVEITAANDLPIVAIALPTVLTCSILDAILDGAGSSAGPEFTYLWTSMDGEILGGDMTLAPQIGAPGTYQLAVTNTVSVCTSFSTVEVLADIVPPTGDAGAGQTLTCSITSLPLSATGSGSPQISFEWSTATGSILSGGMTAMPTISTPGWYNVLITNELNGCTAVDSVEVLADVNLPTAIIAQPVVLNCTVKEATLNATQGTTTGATITYVWTTTNGNFLTKNGLVATVNKPGDYQLLVNNSATGCSITANVTVIEDVQPPTAVAGTDITLTCTTPTESLNGTGSSAGANFSYQWTATNGGNIVGSPTVIDPIIDEPGTYTLVVTNSVNGCTASDAVAALPDATFPIAAIAQPEVLTCIKKEVVIDGSGSSSGAPFTLNWTTVGGNFTIGQTTLKPTANEPGVYNLLITNTSNGCTAIATATVLENIAPPTADAGTGFELTCSVTKGPLNGSATPVQVTTNWTTAGGSIISGSATLAPQVDAPGIYSLLVTRTDNGCTATDNVTVTEETDKPTGITIDLTLPRCDGDVGKIVFATIAGGIEPYLFSINGGASFFSENEFNGIDPGQYTLIVQDVNGCTFTQPLDVPAPLPPTVTILPEIKLELGDSLVLDADLGAFPIGLVDTVLWSPLDYLRFKSFTLPDLLHPTAKPLESTRYKITVISDAGCTATATTWLRVDKTRHVFIPNVISPWNNDGANDGLVIFADLSQVIEIEAFEVFDRWGDKVWSQFNFQPNDPAIGWGAVVRGNKLDPGVFVYWATIRFIDGKKVLYKGDVTLVR